MRARGERLKPVGEFEDVHIGPESISTIEGRVGEVLEAKSGVPMGKQIEPDSHGADDLDGPAEVLHAEFISGEESCAEPGIESHPSVPCRQGQGRNRGSYETGIASSGDGARAGNESGLKPQPRVAQRPSPWKSPDRRDVVQPKIIFLLFS